LYKWLALKEQSITLNTVNTKMIDRKKIQLNHLHAKEKLSLCQSNSLAICLVFRNEEKAKRRSLEKCRSLYLRK